jgi:hypothetical protein
VPLAHWPLVLASALLQETPRDGLTLPTPLVSAVEDLASAGLAFITLTSPRDTYLVGEPIELRLTFGLEREFLRASLVQLFPRPLDVPVQLFASALEPRVGLYLETPEEPTGGATLALGEAIVRAERAGEVLRAGRAFETFELRRTAVATRPGALELEAPALTCAFAREFAHDLLQGRQPLDRHAARVRGSGLRLTVLPPPEAGRPAEFTGALGRVALEAEAEPRELVQGEALVLTLVIEALSERHDLSAAEPPELAHLDGFHLRGRREEREPTRLVVRYELVAERAGTLEIPAIAMATFDLEPPAGYRTVASAPIRVHVRTRAEPPAAPSAQPSERGSRPAPLLLTSLAGLVIVLVLAMRRRRGLRPRKSAP